MLTLYLNSKPAVLKEQTEIKLTRENPLFTDSGDYTFEVSLPLEGCAENLAIFGALHRAEVGKGAWLGKRLRALLVALPLRVEGTAVVTSVTDVEVKVQLLGGRSALNVSLLDEQGRDRYIDELPSLGQALQGAYVRAMGEHSVQTYESTRDAMMRGKLMWQSDENDPTSLRIGDEDATALPLYSTTDKKLVNELCETMARTGAGSGRDSTFGDKSLGLLAPIKRAGSTLESTVFEDSYVFAPQPYLVPLLERVFRALGFEVRAEDNALRGTWFERLIVANVRPTLDYRQMLPHWTAREFVTEVQRFFGVLIEVEGRRLKITRRGSLYAADGSEVVLEAVSDAYTTTLEQQGSRKDVAQARVGYKLSGVPSALALPDEVVQKAERVAFEGFAQFDAVNDLNSSYGTGRVYDNELTGFSHTYLLEHGTESRWALDVVDVLGAHRPKKEGVEDGAEGGPHDEGSKESEVQLRIVPAFAVEGTKRACLVSLVDLSLEPTFFPQPYGYMATSDSATASESSHFSVYRALYPKKEQKKPAKRDVLEVAYYSGGRRKMVDERGRGRENGVVASATSYALPMACGCPYYISQEHSKLLLDVSYRLLLNFKGLTAKEEDAGYSEGMVRDVLTAYTPADTRVLMAATFVHAGALSPTSRYVIRGREYLCQRLEYTLTDEGVSPLVKGYFYEVEGSQTPSRR